MVFQESTPAGGWGMWMEYLDCYGLSDHMSQLAQDCTDLCSESQYHLLIALLFTFKSVLDLIINYKV